MADFVRFESTGLYLPDGSGLAGARLGYLVAAPTAPRIGLTDALDGAGWFVFVPGFPLAPDALGAFVSAALAYLRAPGRERVRFAWFAAPQARPLSGLTIALTGAAGAWTTADRVDLTVANYALRLARGNAVAVDGDATGLRFGPPAGADNVLLASALGLGPQASFPLAGPVELPLIVPAGGGCFGFATSTDDAGLTGLDAGIRYFVTSYDTPGYVDTQRYPVFDLGAARPRKPATRPNWRCAAASTRSRRPTRGARSWAWRRPARRCAPTTATRWARWCGRRRGRTPRSCCARCSARCPKAAAPAPTARRTS